MSLKSLVQSLTNFTTEVRGFIKEQLKFNKFEEESFKRQEEFSERLEAKVDSLVADLIVVREQLDFLVAEVSR